MNKSSRWRHLQDKVAPKTKHLDGVSDVETQKVLPSGKRPDYHGRTWTGERVVGDSKNVQRLTKDHVDQVRGYVRETNASRGFIVVRKTTEISQDVIEYAEQNSISISRMPVTSNAKKMGSIAGFDFFTSGERNREEDVTSKKGDTDHYFGNSIPLRKSNTDFSFGLGGSSKLSRRKSSGIDSFFGSGTNSKPSRRKSSSGFDSMFGLGGSSGSRRKKSSGGFW